MSYRDWHVGMKVVCVDDSNRTYEHMGFTYVKKGSVYTIREMYMTTRLAILVEEVVNRPAAVRGHGIREPGFGACHFRPVQPRKTDISIFTAMLNNQRQEEPA